MTRFHVCAEEDIAEGGRMVVACDKVEIGVFRIGGELYAWYNMCPHLRGPVCQGRIYNRVTEPVAEDGTSRFQAFDEDTFHVVCPWHGYEFDLRTGQHPGDPTVRLRPAQFEVTDGQIYVHA